VFVKNKINPEGKKEKGKNSKSTERYIRKTANNREFLNR
jgi:hypothetical protein